MNCLHCQSDTKVVNSRLRKRSNQVWRRRQCLNCRAIFTTEETVHYQTAWVVRDKSGTYVAFMPDKLVLSLNRSLQHLPTALSDAVSLADTIISKLGSKQVDGMIDRRDIVHVAQVALNRFDAAASMHYSAYHSR